MRTFLAVSIVVTFAVAACGDEEVDTSKRFVLDQLVAQKTTIEKGLNSAKAIADAIDAKKFETFIGTFAKEASSFLSVFNPIVGLVFAFFPTQPSAEYRLLQQLFVEVENRFDKIDISFSALARQVGFLATQIQFSRLEADVRAVQDQFKFVPTATSKAQYAAAIRTFNQAYSNSFEDAASRLYHGIVQGGLTTGDFLQNFVDSTNYDRRKTQDLMMGSMNLLMRAVTLELMHSKLANDPNFARRVSTWNTQLSKVKDKMNQVDQAMARNYHSHAVKDITDFASLRPKGSISNQDFSSQLYHTLSTKYFWRDWFVLSAGVLDGRSLSMHACEYYNHDDHGRTIGVSSVDHTHKHSAYAPSVFVHLKLTGYTGHPLGHPHYFCYDLGNAYNSLPAATRTQCGTYQAVGIFCKNQDVHINAHSGRLSTYTSHDVAEGFLFN